MLSRRMTSAATIVPQDDDKKEVDRFLQEWFYGIGTPTLTVAVSIDGNRIQVDTQDATRATLEAYGFPMAPDGSTLLCKDGTSDKEPRRRTGRHGLLRPLR